jgi:hypothetical protein
MKRLKLIEKRMDANSQRIQQYASAPSNEKPYFGDEDAQRKEVASLTQANRDLTNEYLNLKSQVDMTNLVTKVTIGKDTFTLLSLLVFRRGLSKKMQATFHALNDKNAEERMRAYQVRGSTGTGEKAPSIVRFYDEKQKFIDLQYWQGLDDDIEQRLEVINATTELVTI